MNVWKTALLGAGALAGVSSGSALAGDEPVDLRAALSGGKASLDLRLRYENVDSAAAATPKQARATTLRGRLGYVTAKWHGIDLGVEFEAVKAANKNSYDSAPGATLATDNGVADRPVIADADHEELNQFWVRYAGIPDTTLQYGRQRIVLDNARFVGNVGWRQNEQTYDAFSVVNKSLPKTTLTYANLTDMNSIFGVAFPMDAQLLNAAIALGDTARLTAYGYQLDFDDANTGNRQDSRTLGLRAAGHVPIAASKLLYAAEYARQGDYGDSPDRSADYLLAEVGAATGPVTARLGYEVLGSDDGAYGFQTPLATLHAFNGWADMFLATPTSGLRNVYVQVGGTLVKKLGWTVVGHRFKADRGGADFGDELDAQIAWALFDGFSVGAKYADYNAKSVPAASFATNFDTTKGWLWTEYRF